MKEKMMMGSELQIGNSFRLLTVMKQREYRKLKEDPATHVMSTVDVRKFLAKMFGFEEKKIEITGLVKMFEYDGCSAWRLSDISVGRDPLYNSAEWNYIRFTVCDVCWEVVNGHIYTVAE